MSSTVLKIIAYADTVNYLFHTLTTSSGKYLNLKKAFLKRVGLIKCKVRRRGIPCFLLPTISSSFNCEKSSGVNFNRRYSRRWKMEENC